MVDIDNDKGLPIVIVAPNKKMALQALRNLNLGTNWREPVVLIGNGSIKELEGLHATKERTFFIDPDWVSWSIHRGLHDLFIRHSRGQV